LPVIVSLVFTLKNILLPTRIEKKPLFVVGGLLVVVGIFYVIVEVGRTLRLNSCHGQPESTVKKIGMGLNVVFYP